MKSSLTKGYSRYVNLMKVILPIGILMTVGLAIGWPYLNSLEKEEALVVDTSSPDVKENRMMHPQYMSTDKKGQPFHVDAEWAKRNNDAVSNLVKPHGTMVMNEGETLDLKAKTGQYDSEKSVLQLQGDVTLTSTDGYLVKTQKANVDTENKTIEGNSPIEGKGPAGSIKGADGFKVESREKGEKVITLKGRSRVIINKTNLKKKKVSNAK